MKYLLLIYGEEELRAAQSPEEQEAVMKGYWAFHEEMEPRGVLLGGEALESISTATSVQVRNGETLATDGPFAETKEQLGGYYLVECENLDEAIEIAAKIPNAKDGTVEVRPVWNPPMPS